MKFLLARRADTSIEDSDGRTALANAKKMKQAELIALLEKGAEAAPEKPKPAKKTAKPDKAGKAAK